MYVYPVSDEGEDWEDMDSSSSSDDMTCIDTNMADAEADNNNMFVSIAWNIDSSGSREAVSHIVQFLIVVLSIFWKVQKEKDRQ